MSAGSARFAMFLIIVLTIWTAMHAYVWWRLSATPAVAAWLSPRTLLALLAGLWLAYPIGRIFAHRDVNAVGYPLEVVGAVWMGVLFLLVMAMAVSDALYLLLRVGAALLARPTGGEATAVFRPHGAAALAALALAAIAVVQGVRAPAVGRHEVTLPGLPAERDGTVLVAVSDLHLGTLLGERWWRRRVEQIAAERPDLVAVVGDLVDGSAEHVERIVPALRELRAPLGVWAVTGNHEYYAGLDHSVRVLEDAGFVVLRDRWQEAAPGLIVAGVDDATGRRQFAPQGVSSAGLPASALELALRDRPSGGAVLLSHTPWAAEKAAQLGAGLMLSGHTHDGQIWPFNDLVALQYPVIAGGYDVAGMRLIVCRGTGTWGPPLRLWKRSEILHITLRSGS
jgi:predicted MPP superfamily phosphohydrolase